MPLRVVASTRLAAGASGTETEEVANAAQGAAGRVRVALSGRKAAQAWALWGHVGGGGFYTRVLLMGALIVRAAAIEGAGVTDTKVQAIAHTGPSVGYGSVGTGGVGPWSTLVRLLVRKVSGAASRPVVHCLAPQVLVGRRVLVASLVT